MDSLMNNLKNAFLQIIAAHCVHALIANLWVYCQVTVVCSVSHSKVHPR
jgi:hypothetical protein